MIIDILTSVSFTVLGHLNLLMFCLLCTTWMQKALIYNAATRDMEGL